MTGYCRSGVAHVATMMGEIVNLPWAQSYNGCGLKRVSPAQKNSAMRRCIESRNAEEGVPTDPKLQVPHQKQTIITTRSKVVIQDTIETMLTI